MGKYLKTGKKGIFRRGENWVIDKSFDGERMYQRLPGNIPLALVEKILAKKTADLIEGRFFPGQAGGSLTITDVLNFYWQERMEPKMSRLRSQGLTRKEKHIKGCKYLLTRVADYFGNIPVRSLTVAQVEQYTAKRLSETTKVIKKKDGTFTKGKPVHPRSINRELDFLNVALNWSIKTRRIQFNPIAKFEKVSEDEPEKITFDQGSDNGPEWRRFYDAVSPSHKDLFRTLYETGCRPAEVFEMRWDWINQFSRLIIIPAAITKTGKGREVPISEILWELLKARPRVSDYVFPNPDTGRPYNNVQRAFKGAIRRAGLEGKGLTPYALRRTRLTAWNAIDAVAGMQAAGHSLNGSVHYKHYVSISDDRMQNLVAKAG